MFGAYLCCMGGWWGEEAYRVVGVSMDVGRDEPLI
jgi:hypothetical protein